MAAVGGVTFDAVLGTRRRGGEEEVLLAWMPTWLKASEVPGLANMPWKCTRPKHYMPGAAQKGDAAASGSGSRQPHSARKTARGADTIMDEPPAKRGPGRPRKVPKPPAPKPPAAELMTPEFLYAKRGPGRPPKWLTEARRAAKAAAKPKPVVQPAKSAQAHVVVKRKHKKVSLQALAVGGAVAAPKQVSLTTEQLYAKRGPGRPPKWLTEARSAAEAAQVLAGLVA